MTYNKILFVGLGGAGQRHLRIFQDLLPYSVHYSAFRKTNKTPLLNSDFSVNTAESIETKHRVTIYSDYEDALSQKPDLVVISTPTSKHIEPARAAAEAGIPIFVEKPFSDTLNTFSEFRELIISQKLIFFISFQRRFVPFMQHIKHLIEQNTLGNIINAHFNVASYFPGWHAYEDFRELYAGRKDLGGGVLLTEIHEIDLAYWFFGLPNSVMCSGGNFSDAKMDVEDTVKLVLNYNTFSVSFSLCFMQQHNKRDFHIAGSQGYLEWDANGNRFYHKDYATMSEVNESDPNLSNDDVFYAQARYFLNEFTHQDSTEQLKTAEASLTIVSAAKQSMKLDTTITL